LKRFSSINPLTADVLYIDHEMLAAAVASRTGKIIKNGLNVEREENLLQNGIFNFVLNLGKANHQESH